VAAAAVAMRPAAALPWTPCAWLAVAALPSSAWQRVQMQQNDAQLTATRYYVGVASSLDTSVSMHDGRTIVEMIR